jgi:hypothetical protein
VRRFYYSIPKLFGLATVVVTLGALTCWLATLFREWTSLFVFIVFAAGVFGWVLVRVIRMLLRAENPALTVLTDRITFDTLLHKTEVSFESIKTVTILKPGSEQVGDRLYLELLPRMEGSQRRWRTHTVSLALLNAGGAEIATAVAVQLAAFQAAAANPSVKGTSCGKPQAAPYLER